MWLACQMGRSLLFALGLLGTANPSADYECNPNPNPNPNRNPNKVVHNVDPC